MKQNIKLQSIVHGYPYTSILDGKENYTLKDVLCGSWKSFLICRGKIHIAKTSRRIKGEILNMHVKSLCATMWLEPTETFMWMQSHGSLRTNDVCTHQVG